MLQDYFYEGFAINRYVWLVIG